MGYSSATADGPPGSRRVPSVFPLKVVCPVGPYLVDNFIEGLEPFRGFLRVEVVGRLYFCFQHELLPRYRVFSRGITAAHLRIGRRRLRVPCPVYFRFNGIEEPAQSAGAYGRSGIDSKYSLLYASSSGKRCSLVEIGATLQGLPPGRRFLPREPIGNSNEAPTRDPGAGWLRFGAGAA